MSFYVNPSNCSKEEWLESHGLEIAGGTLSWDYVPYMCVPVILIENGPSLSAAVIAYNLNVLAVATSDQRKKRLFLVKVGDLLGGVAPEFFHWYMRGGQISWM